MVINKTVAVYRGVVKSPHKNTQQNKKKTKKSLTKEKKK
jgi:hypothetical protein